MTGLSLRSWLRSLLSVRLTATMPRPAPTGADTVFATGVDGDQTFDVVIVGDGLQTMATAWHLARRQPEWRIAVVAPAALGTDVAEAALPLSEVGEQDDDLVRLQGLALRFWTELSVIEDPLVVRPWLQIAHSEDDLRCLRRTVYTALRHGLSTQWLDPQQIIDHAPGLLLDHPRWSVVGGYLCPASPLVQGQPLYWAYARQAVDRGVRVFERTSVDSLVHEQGGGFRLVTARGTLTAAQVVLGAGQASQSLAASVGVSIPLACEQACLLIGEAMEPFLPLITASQSLGVTVWQDHQGRLCLLATGEQNDAAAAAVALYPMVSRVRVSHATAFTHVYGPRQRPIIGETPLKGLWVSVGWGRNAVQVAPLVGAELAQMMVTGAVNPVLAPFALSRVLKDLTADVSMSSSPLPPLQSGEIVHG